MNALVEAPLTCPHTGIQYRCAQPGGPPPDGAAPSIVFFLNGIGLDLEGYRDAIQSLDLPWILSKYPYRHGLHVTLTVPGFEDAGTRKEGTLFTMADQSRQVAAFMEHFLARNPAREVILYGFSYGSDLAVEVLACSQGRFAVHRALLAEINVHPHSCFISSRIAASYLAAGSSPNRGAYQDFVSRVVKAHIEGRLSASLMQDMALYFRTIARKDWHQLAQSAEEACDNPEARLARFLGLTCDLPGTRFDLVFSDPQDLRLFQRRVATWGGALGRIRVFDATQHEHFHHMNRHGVLENLGGWVREAGTMAPEAR
jgi:pimeloyl-ACP methyl ester carboxylesterase